jgi:hypothetical protein
MASSLMRIFSAILTCLLQFIYISGGCQTDWSGFKWGHDSIYVNNQKAFVPQSALFLPVSFDGDPHRYYMQLDLSSDIPLLLYSTPSLIDNKLINNQPITTNNINKCFKINYVLKGKLGTTNFLLDSTHYCLMRPRDDTSSNYHHSSSASSIIGTIGLSYFLKKILILDFTHQQFMVLNDTGKVPYRFIKAKFYVPTHIIKSKLIVPVEFADTTFNDFFYETGSSIFDLVVSKKIWRKITGRTGNEKDNFKVTVNTWGEQLQAIGARAKMPIRVNNTYLPTAMVFYLPLDEDFKDTYGCNGMIGNSPFFGKVIVLDFLRNRFGLFPAF